MPVPKSGRTRKLARALAGLLNSFNRCSTILRGTLDEISFAADLEGCDGADFDVYPPYCDAVDYRLSFDVLRAEGYQSVMRQVASLLSEAQALFDCAQELESCASLWAGKEVAVVLDGVVSATHQAAVGLNANFRALQRVAAEINAPIAADDPVAADCTAVALLRCARANALVKSVVCCEGVLKEWQERCMVDSAASILDSLEGS